MGQHHTPRPVYAVRVPAAFLDLDAGRAPTPEWRRTHGDHPRLRRFRRPVPLRGDRPGPGAARGSVVERRADPGQLHRGPALRAVAVEPVAPRARSLRRVHARRRGGHRDRRRHRAPPRAGRRAHRRGPHRAGPRHARGRSRAARVDLRAPRLGRPSPRKDTPMPDDRAIEMESTELLRTLIRNGCVNDGTEGSGQETRSVDALEDFFAGSGLAVERHESRPGRTSLVARIEGRDPAAPRLLLMGHTDVVPANAARWQRDPFGGDLVDGVVWGRGAIDMLNLTATMAVATRRLARGGFRPRGTLIYLAVADEEAGGVHGAGHLIERRPEAVAADYVVTESGGVPIPTAAGPMLPLTVAEKGGNGRRLIVEGTPGHGSR